MSQYVSFFIRCGDKFCPLVTYSRNNKIFEIFGVAPYEHITAVKQKYLAEYLHDLDLELRELEERKRHYEEYKHLIATFNNSVEEKICELQLYEENILTVEEEIKENKYTSDLISFFSSIIDEVKYDKTLNIDAENYLYCGKEIWNPKVGDIA